MITIVIELLSINVKAKALLSLCILAISLYLQIVCQPFASSTLNNLEKQGLFLNLMTLFLGLTNRVGNLEAFQNLFTIFLLISIFRKIFFIYF